MAPTNNITQSFPPEAPLFPEAELIRFIAPFFERRQDFMALLHNHPAPLYLLDPEVLLERASQFRQAFSDICPRTSYYFAVKSNNCPRVSEILVGAGLGLDVSSGQELTMALDLGAQEIIFSGPGKTDAELELAVKNHHRVTILIDSFLELERLAKIATGQGVTIQAGVRLTTNPEGLWRKFGIPLADLARFFLNAEQLPAVNLAGLQFHTSWNLGPEAQVRFIKILGPILAALPERHRQALQFLDIGGGYWPPQGEWLQEAGTPAGGVRKALDPDSPPSNNRYRIESRPIEFFATTIAPVLREEILSQLSCRICFEPGRWICNDAMHLLLTVIDKKGDDLVITDGGTNTVGWERFEIDYFPVLNLSRPALTERKCHILGSLCTPHDVWGYSYWGEDIQPGDILMIPTQGAYTYSLRQNFIKPLPEVVEMERKN
ncbi:MAG: decarboxylase [Proteobacteria bacterium]|nr:decarboxylase [Pseudomonadota bacterium]MBU1686081.1 decarboxylase [Pseudomonadota bacterium]